MSSVASTGEIIADMLGGLWARDQWCIGVGVCGRGAQRKEARGLAMQVQWLWGGSVGSIRALKVTALLFVASKLLMKDLSRF